MGLTPLSPIPELINLFAVVLNYVLVLLFVAAVVTVVNWLFDLFLIMKPRSMPTQTRSQPRSMRTAATQTEPSVVPSKVSQIFVCLPSDDAGYLPANLCVQSIHKGAMKPSFYGCVA